MYFLRSWKDSLSLFLPSNFKLFFLVTIKCIIQAYKNLFKYFWWLIFATGAVDFWFSRYALNSRSHTVVVLSALAVVVVWFVYYFMVYLTIRPSIKPKGYEYYTEYGIYFLYFALYSFITYIIRYLHQLAWYPYITEDLLIYLSPFLTFCILFLLDSDGSFSSACKSIWRGLKMWWYNLPFCTVAYTIFWLISYLLFMIVLQIFGAKSFLVSPIVSALLAPIALCFLNNFYVKRLHDQFTLYFPESIKEQ
jgi:hypothetical protein